jgi:hypothetical protein
MNRRATVTTLAALAVGVAGLTPALAAPGTLSGKTLKGTWSYTDVTADPSPSAMGAAPKLPPRDGRCVGTLPSAPTDVNVHTLKVGGAGTLQVYGKHTGDWAMEVRNSRNKVLGMNDGDLPQVQEGTVVTLPKAGKYKVIYCNLGGAPTASAKYSFRYR